MSADSITRRRFNNEGIVLGQIGIEIAPCPGKCKFCSFGEGHTTFESSVMSDEEILRSADNFTASGELYALFPDDYAHVRFRAVGSRRAAGA